MKANRKVVELPADEVEDPEIREALALVERILERPEVTRWQSDCGRTAASLLRAMTEGDLKTRHVTHLTPKEVGLMLHVDPVTVRQWAARGLLKSVMTPGGHRRFSLKVVQQFARERG